jgi:hypothetical protein
VETEPDRMAAAMLGIPGARIVEARETNDTLDLLIDTEERVVRCPSCGGAVEPAGQGLEDLVPSSAGGRVARVTWRRRQWRCPASGCPVEVFGEEDAGIDPFNERVSAANRRFPLGPVSSPPSDWRDLLEQ